MGEVLLLYGSRDAPLVKWVASQLETGPIPLTSLSEASGVHGKEGTIDHRLPGIGRDLKAHLLTPSTGVGCSNCVQLGLEHCQGWGPSWIVLLLERVSQDQKSSSQKLLLSAFPAKKTLMET